MIHFNNISFSYSDEIGFKALNVAIPLNKITFLLGENGSGKTTFIKLLLGLLTPQSGEIVLGDEALQRLTTRQRARLMAYIPQEHSAVFNIAVEDVILMGCANALSAFAEPDLKARRRARQIATELHIEHLLSKGYKQISGGERQLCLIARALLQDAKIIAMDEPTANLDFAHKLNFFKLIKRLSAGGITVIMSSHQPENALKYGDYVVFMKDKRCIDYGAVNETMTVQNLSKLYGIDIANTPLASECRRRRKLTIA